MPLVWNGLGKGGQEFMVIVLEHQMSVVKSALDWFARYKDLHRFLTILSSGRAACYKSTAACHPIDQSIAYIDCRCWSPIAGSAAASPVQSTTP